MSREERMNLIEEIEENRDSRLLTYITGDRRGLATKISTDAFPKFHRLLMKIGHQKRIDLFLYSTGGLTIAGYALVNLIREFCDEFNVIIPFKALSCATLIALGANEVITSPLGQFSPIDPSIQHPLAPVVQIQGRPPQPVPVSVEDVAAFINLAKKEIGLKNEESLSYVLEHLSQNIHPLVLGAVERSRQQIEFLATNLMKIHCNDENIINNVVQTLIRERFSHNYIISRNEAKETLKLNIIDPSPELTANIDNLFECYNQIMLLDTRYNLETALGGETSVEKSFDRAILESKDITFSFRSIRKISKVQTQQPRMPLSVPLPPYQYLEQVLREEWVEDNTL
ncbi:MAG: SDH family Clp fold serine proteinase [Candidatus Hodarchaeales archaeon]